MKNIWESIKRLISKQPKSLPICHNCKHHHPGDDDWWTDGCGCHVEGCGCTWTW